MFYIHSIAGQIQPYTALTLPIRRGVERVAPVSSIERTTVDHTTVTSSQSLHVPYKNESPATNRRLLLYARDIMSTPVTTIPVTQSIGDAAALMQTHRFRHIPVVNDAERLVGIMSDRDVMKHSGEIGAPVSNIMATDVLAAAPDAEIREIAKVMFNHHVGVIPIVHPDGTIAGVITRSDILRAVLNHPPLDMWS